MIDDGALQKWFQRIRNLESRVSGVSASTDSLTTTVSGLPGADTLAPAAPASVAIASSTYQNTDGGKLAQAQVSWPAVTTNSDGSACTDLSGYLVSWKLSSGSVWSGETFVAAGTTAVIFQGFTLGQTIDARVRAQDAAGNDSGYTTVTSIALTTDTTPPNQPSTPTVTGVLAGIRVVWDGKDSTAAAMPADFDHYEVHQSTTSGFTPSAATLADSLPTAGGASTIPLNDYGTTHYVKIIAYDRSQNASTPSAQATGTPTQAVDADLLTATITNRVMGANSVATANIQNAAITTALIGSAQVVTAAIANLAVTDAKIGDCSITKLTAGTLTADLTVSARIKTANTGQRVELNSTGLQCYDSSGTLTVNISAGTATISSATITGATITAGTIQTASSGQRARMNSSTNAFEVLNAFGVTGKVYSDTTYAYDNVLIASGTCQLRLVSGGGGGLYLDGTPGYINFNTAVATDITPATSGTDNLGSSSARWIGWFTDIGSNGVVTMTGGSVTITPSGVLDISATSGVKCTTFGSTAGTSLCINASNFIGKGTSSRRYKKSIRYDTAANYQLLELTPVTYISRDPGAGDRRWHGVLAEDAAELVPGLVIHDEQGRPDAVMYERIPALLLPIVRDINARLARLETT